MSVLIDLRRTVTGSMLGTIIGWSTNAHAQGAAPAQPAPVPAPSAAAPATAAPPSGSAPPPAPYGAPPATPPTAAPPPTAYGTPPAGYGTPPAAPPGSAPPGTYAGPAPSAPVDSRSSSAPKPVAARGFQMAFRTGVAFPVGEASGTPNDDLADRYAWQIPFSVDLGAKVSDSLYLGAYFGVGFGAEGSDVTIEDYCRDDDEDFENDIACSVITLQAGIEARYSFSPDEDWNPWLGYGLGFESARQSIEDRNQGYREVTTASGLTFAKLSAGADYRSKVGIGPVGEVAIGRFTGSQTEVNGVETFDGDVDDPAFHAWLTVGLRMVINP